MSAVSVQVLAAGWLLTLFLSVRRRSFTLAEATGDDEMKRLALTGLVLVLSWLVAPGGFLFTGVLVLLLSLASPAGRLAWRGWWSSRTPKLPCSHGLLGVGLVHGVALGISKLLSYTFDGSATCSHPVSPGPWVTGCN